MLQQEGDRLTPGGHIELVSLSKRFVEMAVDANKRNVNTVFQSYALFPFLDVRENHNGWPARRAKTIC